MSAGFIAGLIIGIGIGVLASAIWVSVCVVFIDEPFRGKRHPP